MAESGDWVTPRLYGKPWFEKPVLYYWMAAASFKLFGVSEAAARLPSALCALFATLSLAWLAWRGLWRRNGAMASAFVTDKRRHDRLLPRRRNGHAVFSGMLTIAMVCAAVVLGLVRNENSPVLPRTQWLALIFFGFFLGLAVLAKGPAAIILCGGAVFFWALTDETLARCVSPASSRRDRFVLRHCPALVRPLRAPQSRLLPRLHHRTQFQTLPHARIPTHSAVWYYVPVLLAMFFRGLRSS